MVHFYSALHLHYNTVMFCYSVSMQEKDNCNTGEVLQRAGKISGSFTVPSQWSPCTYLSDIRHYTSQNKQHLDLLQLPGASAVQFAIQINSFHLWNRLELIHTAKK